MVEGLVALLQLEAPCQNYSDDDGQPDADEDDHESVRTRDLFMFKCFCVLCCSSVFV